MDDVVARIDQTAIECQRLINQLTLTTSPASKP
jgi:hypothetical protein